MMMMMMMSATRLSCKAKIVGLHVLRDGATSWHLSGAVLLVGPWDSTLDSSLPGVGEAFAVTVDVRVQQEEAKPQVYVDGGG